MPCPYFGYGMRYNPTAKAMGDNYIWVNRYGKRFACESPTWIDHRASMGYEIWDWSDTQKDARYPCIPFYLIFDEKTRLAGHNWDEFMAFGRIAGRNAAAEKPWC